MKTKGLAQNEISRWTTLAVQAAIRSGDKTWLEEINRTITDRRDGAITSHLISAMRYLQAGDYDEARALLQRIPEPEKLGEISRRRYLELSARVEQFDEDPKAERTYITQLVDFAGDWGTPTCQTCHADPKKFGDKTTTLDIAHWWVGARYTALLKQQGDETATRQAAEKALKENPADNAARLRLAYALRAEKGDAAEPEVEALLRALPWAEFPDREKRPPLQFSTFP